jgi:hypothetical protein
VDTTIPDENVVALRSIRPVALPQSTTVSTVLVLGTESDGRQERLRSGEALSAVLLEATVGGTHDGPRTHMPELRQSREIIREPLPDGGYPKALIRVGTTGHELRPRQTARRPTDTVGTGVVVGDDGRPPDSTVPSHASRPT